MTFGRAVMALALVLVAACSPIYETHGYVPPETALQDVRIGDDQTAVAQAVGRPSAAGILNDTGWYYVQSRFRIYGYREKREVDRQVVAISFNDAERVSNIERFGLDEGRVVRLSRRTTDPTVSGFSFLRQLFGSIGNINPVDFLN